nr:unnamed protein product [Spirometra erinaceieuropaei]
MSTVSGNDPPLATSVLYSKQLCSSPQLYPICITNSVNIGKRVPSHDIVDTEPTSPTAGVKIDSTTASAMFENLEAVGLIPKSIPNGIGSTLGSLKERKLLPSSSTATVDIPSSPAFTSTGTPKPMAIVDEASQTTCADAQSSCQTNPGESGCLEFVAAEFKKINRRLDDLQRQLSDVKEAVISVENHVLRCSISPHFHSRSAARQSDSPLTQPGVVNCRLTEVPSPFKNTESTTSNTDTSSSSKPCQADDSHVFSSHSGPPANSSAGGSATGDREASDGYPSADSVPTESNPSENPTNSIDLDPARIAAAVRKSLNRWGIGQRIFAQRVLNLSQGTVSELLSKPKSWNRLTEKGRTSYRRMAEWLNNPDSVRELRRFAKQESSTRAYLTPPISRWWAKRRLTARTISSHGSPSTLATPMRSLRSRKPYCSKLSMGEASMKTGISSNGPASSESDSESGESTDTQARIANLLLNARLAMASAKASPVPNPPGKAETRAEDISVRCGDGLPTVGDSGNSNSASSSEVTTASELPPRPVSLSGSHSQPEFTSSPSSGLSVGSQHLMPPVCPVGMFGPPAASAMSCLPNFSPNHISVHFSSPLTCVSPNRVSEEYLDPLASSLLGGSGPSCGGPLLPSRELASDTAVTATMSNSSAPCDGETEAGPPRKPGTVYNVPPQLGPGDLCLSLPPREVIASMGPLNTAEIAQRTKETLQRHSISQRAFGLRVLGLSQGSVSDLLTRPKPWKTLTHKGREPYIRMHIFLENPSLLSKEGPSPVSSFSTPSAAEGKANCEQSGIVNEAGSDRTPPLKHVLNLFNEPLRHAVDINSEEGLSMMMNGLEIPPLVVEVKEALTARNMSQRVFGNTVLGLTQASVSDLLSKIRPWNQLTVRGRESYVRMRLWLDSLKKTSGEIDSTPGQNENSSVETRAHADALSDKQPAAKRARRPAPISAAGTTASVSRSSSGSSSMHSEAAPLTATVLAPSLRRSAPVPICRIPEPDPSAVALLPTSSAAVPLTPLQPHRTALSAANAIADPLATAAVYSAPPKTVTHLPSIERGGDSETVEMLAAKTKSEEVAPDVPTNEVQAPTIISTSSPTRTVSSLGDQPSTQVTNSFESSTVVPAGQHGRRKRSNPTRFVPVPSLSPCDDALGTLPPT